MSTERPMRGTPADCTVEGMTRNFPPGGIRVSDADRDAAIGELSEHFQAGRLTQEEFDERAGLALRARTGNDLNELFTDLPLTGEAARQAAAAQPPGATQSPYQSQPGPPPGSPPALPPQMTRRHGSPAPAVIILVLVGIAASEVARATGPHHGTDWLVPVIVALIIMRIIIRRARRW
jgi:hypothetical protein